MGWEDEGQFTGEISPLMLKEVGTQIVEIGHSERRHVLGETDWMENQKVRCALRHGFTPLLCIGETGEQKALGLSDEVLRTQLKAGLHGVTAAEAARLWIAYEPVWAIGVSGVPASPGLRGREAPGHPGMSGGAVRSGGGAHSPALRRQRQPGKRA